MATKHENTGGMPNAVKLVIGAGGIYAAFLYYGTLQEDVFHYVAADGSKFKAAWFLQTLGTFSSHPDQNDGLATFHTKQLLILVTLILLQRL